MGDSCFGVFVFTFVFSCVVLSSIHIQSLAYSDKFAPHT
jgi:hypothetical protein